MCMVGHEAQVINSNSKIESKGGTRDDEKARNELTCIMHIEPESIGSTIATYDGTWG